MDKILNAIVIISVPSVIDAAFVYVGRKLQILSDLKTDVAKMKNNLKVVSCVSLVLHRTGLKNHWL